MLFELDSESEFFIIKKMKYRLIMQADAILFGG